MDPLSTSPYSGQPKPSGADIYGYLKANNKLPFMGAVGGDNTAYWKNIDNKDPSRISYDDAIGWGTGFGYMPGVRDPNRENTLIGNVNSWLQKQNASTSPAADGSAAAGVPATPAPVPTPAPTPAAPPAPAPAPSGVLPPAVPNSVTGAPPGQPLQPAQVNSIWDQINSMGGSPFGGAPPGMQPAQSPTGPTAALFGNLPQQVFGAMPSSLPSLQYPMAGQGQLQNPRYGPLSDSSVNSIYSRLNGLYQR
jgi:hypothetical protein